MTDGLTGVREIFEERITDNGIFKIQSWHRTYEPAPPKDWVQKIAMLKQQVIELEDANRYLAKVIDELMATRGNAEDNGSTNDRLEHFKNPRIGTTTLEGLCIRWPFNHKKVDRQSRKGRSK